MNNRLKQAEKKARRVREVMKAFIVLDDTIEGSGFIAPDTLVSFHEQGEHKELKLSEFERLYDKSEFELTIIHIVDVPMSSLVMA